MPISVFLFNYRASHNIQQADVPDMTFAVGFRRESKLTDTALEWSLSIVCSQVSIQGAAVGTGVWTLITLVWRRADMQ